MGTGQWTVTPDAGSTVRDQTGEGARPRPSSPLQGHIPNGRSSRIKPPPGWLASYQRSGVTTTTTSSHHPSPVTAVTRPRPTIARPSSDHMRAAGGRRGGGLFGLEAGHAAGCYDTCVVGPGVGRQRAARPVLACNTRSRHTTHTELTAGAAGSAGSKGYGRLREATEIRQNVPQNKRQVHMFV